MTSFEHTPAKNTAMGKPMSSTTTVTMTNKVTCDDAAGENGEPGQVGGVGLTSERPGSAHDGSETDSQPVRVTIDTIHAITIDTSCNHRYIRPVTIDTYCYHRWIHAVTIDTYCNHRHMLLP